MAAVSRLGLGRATTGLGHVSPLGGLGRVTRGFGLQSESATPVETDPTALFSTETVDSNGTPHLLSNDILDTRFVEVDKTCFAHPDREFTGYASDGYWRTEGQLDPTHSPFRASWALEDASTHRGDRESFPPRLLVITTRKEVVLLDADSLDVWMRFIQQAGTPPGRGTVAGGSNTLLRQADWGEGFLVLATSTGLRIVSFREDRAYVYDVDETLRSASGLSARNTTDYMDGTDITHPSRLVANTDNTCVDIGNIATPATTLKNRLVLCAAGGADGLTGLVLSGPGLSYPSAKKSMATATAGVGWEIEDDLDGDGYSPYLIDGGTNWLALGVGPGDIVVTDDASTHVVVRVEQSSPGHRLVLSPELPLAASGTTYSLTRGCSAVAISMTGGLYFVDGCSRLVHIPGEAWHSGGAEVYDNMMPQYPSSSLGEGIEKVYAMALGVDTLVASSLGVHGASDADLEERRGAEFRYATAAQVQVQALYAILAGEGTVCESVVVDPETSNVLVSVKGEGTKKSVVTEISVATQKAFRYYDKVGRVRSLVAYRNPNGPEGD